MTVRKKKKKLSELESFRFKYRTSQLVKLVALNTVPHNWPFGYQSVLILEVTLFLTSTEGIFATCLQKGVVTTPTDCNYKGSDYCVFGIRF